MADLSAEQKELITETWAILEKDKEIVGLAIFTLMFERHPDYVEFFNNYTISGGSKGLLAKDNFVKDHIVGTVMKAIGKLVSNIEKPATLESVLTQLGKSHAKRNINKQHFESIKVVLATTVKNHLSTRWTPEVEEAWTIFLGIAFTLIYKGL